MRSRISYYLANMITEQIGRGGHYSDLKPVVCIIITDYDFIPETSRCHTAYRMLETEELLKMESLSKGNCAVLTVSRGSHSRNRRALRMLLSEKLLSGLSVEVNLFYDLLYAMGRRPGVLNYPEERATERLPAEEAEDLFLTYYSIFGFTSERDREIIKNFVRDNQSDGFLEDLVCLSPALVFWQVP
jgi:hypothetical protein